uniref:Uncharacterized protein n=1 Tax=Plectus sambesii TaxID=2011161 RepID=A0A914W9Z2_9BILA
MIKFCCIVLLLLYRHAQCQTSDDYEDLPATPFHPSAPEIPDNARNINCSTTRNIYRSQLPFMENDDNFYCGNYWWDKWIYVSPYLRIVTQLNARRPFQLRVAVRSFKTETVGPYASNFYRGFWISPRNDSQNFQPGTDIPNGFYDINCMDTDDCTFTTEPNRNIDIFMYFDDYAINSYSFVIEDVTKLL